MSLFSVVGIFENNFGQESVVGRAHRRELGVVPPLAFDREQLAVNLVTCND